MSDEVHARLAEPFFTTKQTGTGPGLASTAAAVRRLNGTLNVQGWHTRGTRVSIDLPIALEAD
jgi:C4-dicarboxylate-specific signal transduction histidine kinase